MSKRSVIRLYDQVYVAKDDENCERYGQVTEVKDSDEGKVFVVALGALGDYQTFEYMTEDLELDELPF